MIRFKRILLGVVALCSFSFLVMHSAMAGPKWTFEASAGVFEPDDENWSSYYGSKKMPEVSFSFARRFFSVLDVGASLNYGYDTGKGSIPSTGTKVGSVKYHMVPVDVYMVLRARFSERQWVVPYVGGGYTRFNYRQEIKGQGSIRGGTDGHHLRAGLQILLDPLEQGAARDIYDNYGVINSYLILEARQTTAKTKNPEFELDGLSYKVGFLLEY